MAEVKGLGGVHKVKGLIDKNSHDSDAVLDTGIKVSQVVKEAKEWWEKSGRDQMRAYRFSKNSGGKGISADPHDANFIPSGITQGLPWDELTKDECLSIVKNFHHQKYRIPQREEKNALIGIVC